MHNHRDGYVYKLEYRSDSGLTCMGDPLLKRYFPAAQDMEVIALSNFITDNLEVLNSCAIKPEWGDLRSAAICVRERLESANLGLSWFLTTNIADITRDSRICVTDGEKECVKILQRLL